MRRIAVWGMMAVLGMPVIAAGEGEQAGPEAGIVVRAPAPATEATREPGPGVQFYMGTLDGPSRIAEAKDSKYWLGLSCAPVDDALRSQLGLEAGSGLVIRQVADKSPAKVVGLAVHDVITDVKIGDSTHKPADISQLTTLVQEAKPMMFFLLRQGKPLNLALMPRLRNVEGNELRNRQALRDSAAGGGIHVGPSGLTYRMAGPVVAFDGASPATANLPDDLTVIITKSGSEPLHIAIRQKDRGEWRMRENETALQPEEISRAVIKVMAYLSQLVGRVDQHEGKPVFRLEPGSDVHHRLAERYFPTPIGRRGELRAGAPAGPSATITYQEREPDSIQQRSFQQQFDAIQKQQEQVTKALDELRQSLQKLQPQN